MSGMCQWDETYDLLPKDLECVLSFCGHPHDYAYGSHDPPPSANDLELITPSGYMSNPYGVNLSYLSYLWNVNNWRLNFGSKIKYRCTGTKHFELPEPMESDPTWDELEVECLNTGVYNTPILESKVWPNCTETVACGQPLPHPVDGRVNGTNGHDGSIAWLHGVSMNTETYNTTVQFSCAEGSKFDTNNDGSGDTLTIETRCLWNKTWSWPSSLPACHVTHCIAPYSIPSDTNLVEVTSAWTQVNQPKQYKCKGAVGNTHTRFWESDRSKSTFEIQCRADGSYNFDNLRGSWPTCLEDVECDKRPPEVPTSVEYTLPAYDGSVHVASMVYPVVPVMNRTESRYNSSTTTGKLLPRNYLTNLTYSCGSARNFITDSGAVEFQNMSCQWDRSWLPSAKLASCDWIACLKPPTPPPSTNLRVTHWDGQPVPFGEDVHFVCARGLKFEEDPTQEEITYSCQDGSAPKTKKGFFDVPEKEEDWPRCLQG